MLQVDIAIFCLLQSNSGSCPTDGSQPVIMRRGHGSVSEMPHSCLLLECSDATARWIIQVVFHSHIFQPMQVIVTIFPCIIVILNFDHEPICIEALFRFQKTMQNFCKSLAWCTKCSQKINRITQMDCKSRDESNESNYDVISH